MVLDLPPDLIARIQACLEASPLERTPIEVQQGRADAQALRELVRLADPNGQDVAITLANPKTQQSACVQARRHEGVNRVTLSDFMGALHRIGIVYRRWTMARMVWDAPFELLSDAGETLAVYPTPR